MTEKRVLFVSYRFPPQSEGGVIRVIKFAKYLARTGWNVDLMVPVGSTLTGFEKDLASDRLSILPVHCPQPFEAVRTIARRFRVGSARGDPRSGGNEGPNTSRRRASLLIRLFLLLRFPDEAVFWGRPLRKALNGYFRRHPDCGTIYLHGPPFSPFLAIRHWAGKAGKRVVYDFRDPWSLDSDYFYPFEFLKNVVRKWEARILKSSSSIVVISDLFRQRLIEMEPTVSEHSFVITNGFDPEDTDFIRTRIPPKFVIAHGGSLEGRDPVSLLRGVARFLKDRVEAKGATALRLWGSSDDDLKSKVGELGLLPWCDIQGGRPHHEWLASCDDVALFVLVLQQGEHYDLAIPGKLFEYVGMGRPVLAFVPDGEARRMINRNEWGCTFSGNPDPEAVASAIGKYFDRWRAGNLIPFNREATLVPFRRDRLAVSLGEILAHG